MRATSAWFLVIPNLVFAACAGVPDTEPDIAEEAPGRPSPSASVSASATPGRQSGEPPDTAMVAGWTVAGNLAVFNAGTGAVVAEAQGACPGAGRDVAVDRWLARVLLLCPGAAGPGSEVASHTLEGAGDGLTLGTREHEAWLDGPARLAASPFGAVAFEATEAPQWRLLSADGEPPQGVPGPLPASLVTSELPGGTLRLSALSYGLSGDAAEMLAAQVTPDGVSAPVHVPLLGPPLSAPLSARWVESAGGGQIIDAADGDVVVSTFAGSGWPPRMPAGVGPGLARVEQAVSFPGGERLALLVSGTADVVIVNIAAGGAPECAAALDLPGEAEPAAKLFARGLALVGPDRLLAATSAGVFAVTVSAACPPALAVEPAFKGSALRGPLDVLP